MSQHATINMQIIEGLREFHIEGESAVAIGKFDGIHLGHRQLIRELLAQKENGRRAVIFTFDPEPASFFSGKIIPGLSTREEKRKLFEESGIDILVEYPLTQETAKMEPEKFISDILVGMLHAVFITAGTDVSYGNAGRGDYRLLQRLSTQYGYEVQLIGKVSINRREISSTYVRAEVASGHMEMAEKLLGMPYCVSGIIEHGRHLGHTIGIPTINLIPPDNKLLPPNGVYYSLVKVEGKTYRGMTNIGCKPTVTDEGKMGVETYLYDFSGDIYGHYAEVFLLAYRRTEKHFKTVAELQAQMEKDVADGTLFHQEYHKNTLQNTDAVIK